MEDWIYEWGPLGQFIGELDPDTCSPEEWEEARIYCLSCLMESDHDQDTLALMWDWLEIFHPEFAGMIDWVPNYPSPFEQMWIPVKDGHPGALRLYERHYSSQSRLSSRKRKKSKRFVGPGERIVLVTPMCDALFVWRRERFMQSYQHGVNCAVFRNESAYLSSEMILLAEEFARQKWPMLPRFFTYVNPDAVNSTNPGYCFIKAGWERMRIRTKEGLLIYEKKFLPPIAVELL